MTGKGEVTIEPSFLDSLLIEAGLRITGRGTVPARPGSTASVPRGLANPLHQLLEQTYHGTLYKHQSMAIERALTGEHICMATPTASGKSLVFMALAANTILTSSDVRVLALYPARALIQDQLEKWRQILAPLGIPYCWIDGGVPMAERLERLRGARVALMTPDVAHAWLMSNLHQETVRAFLRGIRLLILDEAHVYEGVFGTNMAFFLRRLEVATGDPQIVCTTATLGNADEFFQSLTGKTARVFGSRHDASPSPEKEIVLTQPPARAAFECTRKLLLKLAERKAGRFIAFGDSRKEVERIVASVHRGDGGGDDEVLPDEAPPDGELPDPGGDLLEDLDTDVPGSSLEEIPSASVGVLPYRAGYEANDRRNIQQALSDGSLAGVVSTSALELGLDIGDIDIAVLLELPPSVKSFWQRLGRAGRQRTGSCIVIDRSAVLGSGPESLDAYLSRDLEPNWFYLENRYIQYAHALCAAIELPLLGVTDVEPPVFESLPDSFPRFLANEIDPTEVVPSDLYPLKQRGQGDPHHEFPLRGAADPSFKVVGPFQKAIGELSLAQVLREAYPGGVYYYMARPYRVKQLRHREREIRAVKERYYTTQPTAQTMVFPKFPEGILSLFESDSGFVAETTMQVSERLLGFVERRGGTRTEHTYGPGSPYEQRPLTRFFETTGVCWYIGRSSRDPLEIGQFILRAFCSHFGIQERDLGFGVFTAKLSPAGREQIQGLCIYDATQGSLRLTQRLAEEFQRLIELSLELAESSEELQSSGRSDNVLRELKRMTKFAADLKRATPPGEVIISEHDGDWVQVIAPEQPAMFLKPDGGEEVHVDTFRYTPQGIVYDLIWSKPGSRSVPANALQPIYGVTEMLLYNLITGETKPLA